MPNAEGRAGIAPNGERGSKPGQQGSGALGTPSACTWVGIADSGRGRRLNMRLGSEAGWGNSSIAESATWPGPMFEGGPLRRKRFLETSASPAVREP